MPSIKSFRPIGSGSGKKQLGLIPATMSLPGIDQGMVDTAGVGLAGIHDKNMFLGHDGSPFRNGVSKGVCPTIGTALTGLSAG